MFESKLEEIPKKENDLIINENEKISEKEIKISPIELKTKENIEFNFKQKENLINNSISLYEEIYGKKSRISVGHQHKQILFMVMDYYDKNLMQFAIKTRFSGNDLKYISKQLITGLLSAHKKNICHRDLKPQNLLINK